MNALRAFYRVALSRGLVGDSPSKHLMLPAVRSKRERIATPAEAEALLEAVPPCDRAIWAAAFYAGLRLGEIQALSAGNVHLDEGYISVEKSWDRRAGLIEPKSTSAVRRVPILGRLRPYLEDLMLERTSPADFLFGPAPSQPFNPDRVRRTAYTTWDEHGLCRILFHEARHTFASFLITSGELNPKEISTYLGHSSISTTYDIYGHLFPGSEIEAARSIDRYLERAKVAGSTPIATPVGGPR